MQNHPSYSFKVREEEEIIIRFYAHQAYETISTHICKVYWRSSDDPGKERGIFSDDDDVKFKKQQACLSQGKWSDSFHLSRMHRPE